MNEILLIDKPSGISSFDVVRKLRKKRGKPTPASASGGKASAGKHKIGHAGTLDPLATGLLIVGVGGATKRMNEFLKLPKTYEAEITLGIKTDTGDAEGRVIEEKDASEISREEVEKAVSSLEGSHDLPVPVYSAVKQGGKPLYWRARRGEDVRAPQKTMKINNAVVRKTDYEGSVVLVSVTFDVESGTYIRSLAEELGRRLNTCAMLSALRRTRVGPYKVEDAKALEAFYYA